MNENANICSKIKQKSIHSFVRGIQSWITIAVGILQTKLCVVLLLRLIQMFFWNELIIIRVLKCDYIGNNFPLTVSFDYNLRPDGEFVYIRVWNRRVGFQCAWNPIFNHLRRMSLAQCCNIEQPLSSSDFPDHLIAISRNGNDLIHIDKGAGSITIDVKWHNFIKLNRCQIVLDWYFHYVLANELWRTP